MGVFIPSCCRCWMNTEICSIANLNSKVFLVVLLKKCPTKPKKKKTMLMSSLDPLQQHRRPHSGVAAEALSQAAAGASHSFCPLPGVSGLRSEAAERTRPGNCCFRFKEGGQSVCSDTAGERSNQQTLILIFLFLVKESGGVEESPPRAASCKLQPS